MTLLCPLLPLAHPYGVRWFSYTVLARRSYYCQHRLVFWFICTSHCWSLSGCNICPLELWVAIMLVTGVKVSGAWTASVPFAGTWSCSACHRDGSGPRDCWWGGYSGCHEDWSNCSACLQVLNCCSPCWSLSPPYSSFQLKGFSWDLGWSQSLNPRFQLYASLFWFPTSLFQRYSEDIYRDEVSLIWRWAERAGVAQDGKEKPPGTL